jgi:hypothetical protein
MITPVSSRRIQLVVATVDQEVVVAKNGRPGVPRPVQAVFWDGVRAGLGVKEAGLAAGVGSNMAKVWFRQAGGVKANGPGRVSGRYLPVAEREEIAVGVAAGQPVRAIAARLGRHPSTVSREVRRNGSRGRYRGAGGAGAGGVPGAAAEDGEAGGECAAARVGAGAAGRTLVPGAD